MALETVVNIADLVRTNPAGSDPTSQGDNHIRNIKTALLNDLAGYTGAIWMTGVDGGAVNAYTLTPANALVANGLRMGVVFSPTVTNTGPATMNISGLGAVAIKQVHGPAVVAGDLVAGVVYSMLFNGTEYRLMSPTKNYMDQLAVSAALPGQVGNATKIIRTDGAVALWDNFRLYRSVRSANTIIGDADGGRLIDYSAGGFTQTWSSVGVLGEGFFVRIRNASQTDSIELEAPATNTQASTTSNSIAAGTTWTIATGLTIGAGDLVNVRRTSDGFNQRIIGVVASYTSGTGVLIVTPSYRIGSGTFTDWTITTRPAANGIDGLGSYVMYSNECRDFVVSGSAIVSVIVTEFDKIFTATERFIPPPRYVEFEGIATSGAGGGARSGGSNLGPGGPGGGAFPFRLPASLFGAFQDILVGAGGGAITSPSTGTSNPGGDTTIGALLTVKGAATNVGGAVDIAQAASSTSTDFGSFSPTASSRSAIWGGVSPSSDASANGGSTIYGGPCGGSISSAGAIRLPGTSLNGAVAGAAGDAASGGDGVGLAAGGGGTRTGTRSGAGTGGQLRMSGRA